MILLTSGKWEGFKIPLRVGFSINEATALCACTVCSLCIAFMCPSAEDSFGDGPFYVYFWLPYFTEQNEKVSFARSRLFPPRYWLFEWKIEEQMFKWFVAEYSRSVMRHSFNLECFHCCFLVLVLYDVKDGPKTKKHFVSQNLWLFVSHPACQYKNMLLFVLPFTYLSISWKQSL